MGDRDFNTQSPIMQANASKRGNDPTPNQGLACTAQPKDLWVPYSCNGHGPSVAERRCTVDKLVSAVALLLANCNGSWGS
jgi:hypothetical protein